MSFEPALNPCGDCGRSLVEVCWTEAGDWLCLSCYGDRGAQGSYVPPPPVTAPSSVDVPVPVPSVEGERDDLFVLLDDHARGLVTPVRVETRELPKWATPSMRLVLEDLAFCSGLHLAMGDDGTVIYAVEPMAERTKISVGAMSTALKRLRACKAIRLVKVLPPVPPKPVGCRVYAVVPGRPNLQVLDGGAE